MNLRENIIEYTKAINYFTKLVNDTVSRRNESREAYDKWKSACNKFHGYTSPIDEYVLKCHQMYSYDDPEVREFAICYLEEDPWYFRSGYFKQVLLTHLKRTLLSDNELYRLRQVLYKAVIDGRTHFRNYCRLSSAIANNELIEKLEDAINIKEHHVEVRAKMMLGYIKRHGKNT